MGEFSLNEIEVVLENFRLKIESVKISSGKILGVVGKSGAGKTTLLQAIAGFVPLSSGSISISGREVAHLPPEKRQVSLVFQRPWLFENRDVLRNVTFGLELKDERKDFISQAREWLRRMDISDLENRKPWELSGGQAQRVALARAMAVQFPVLLLDEPFSALDGPLKKELRKLCRELVQQNNIYAVLVSHDPKDIEELSDQVIVLDDGKVIAEGTFLQLKKHENQNVSSIFEY